MLFTINFDKKESKSEDGKLKQKIFPEKVSATLATSATFLDTQGFEACCGSSYLSATLATLVSKNSYLESQAQQGLQRKVAKVAKVADKNYKKNYLSEYWSFMFEERASIYECDAGLDKKESEIKAFDDCIIKWLEVNKSNDVDSAIRYLLSCGLHNPFYVN